MAGISRTGVALQIKADQRFSKTNQNACTEQTDQQADHTLETERIPQSLVVIISIKLGAQNTSARNCAKNTDVIYKNQLVHDRYAGHLLRSNLSDHDVIQHTDKIRNPVLNHDWNRYHQNPAVEIPVTEQLSHLVSNPLNLSSALCPCCFSLFPALSTFLRQRQI